MTDHTAKLSAVLVPLPSALPAPHRVIGCGVHALALVGRVCFWPPHLPPLLDVLGLPGVVHVAGQDCAAPVVRQAVVPHRRALEGWLQWWERGDDPPGGGDCRAALSRNTARRLGVADFPHRLRLGLAELLPPGRHPRVLLAKFQSPRRHSPVRWELWDAHPACRSANRTGHKAAGRLQIKSVRPITHRADAGTILSKVGGQLELTTHNTAVASL
eukprot:SAG11_NODE_4214_length_2010_cov_4.048142_1_plen_215_part_00